MMPGQGSGDLRGLVLCGGQSSRMGRDKGSLRYGACDQRERALALLAPHCAQSFISCWEGQYEEIPAGAIALFDLPGFEGPTAGLLSAHARDRESSWLVLACDMPLLNDTALARLIAGRDPLLPATACSNGGRIEPLCAIWEPSALEALALLGGPGPSPRRLLEEIGCKRIEMEAPLHLFNANTPEERSEALRILAQKDRGSA